MVHESQLWVSQCGKQERTNIKMIVKISIKLYNLSQQCLLGLILLSREAGRGIRPNEIVFLHQNLRKSD